MDTLPSQPRPAPRKGADRIYVGMREVSTADDLDGDSVSLEALQHHLAAQAAIDNRRIRKAMRREWIAAAAGVVLLVVALGALLVASVAGVWP